MAEQIISAADLEAAGMSTTELISYMEEVIKLVRNNDVIAKNLQSKLSELDKINTDINKNSSVAELFACYTLIQQISMEIRKLLSQYMNLAIYDSIEYSLYYEGQRYATEHLNLSWLRVNSKGTLQLQMNKAVEELKTTIVDEVKQKVAISFNKHYATFLTAISGTYNGIIGRGGALNKGHIAEAFEEHMEEHHSDIYKIINNLENSTDTLTVADKMLINYEQESDSISYWANHEGISAAWQHIRNALGTQRGTVAGDVLGRQVKQTKKGAANVRLASLNTLKMGIATYSMILGDGNDNPPVKEVAILLVNYMAEPVRQVSAKIINNIVDPEIQDMFNILNEQARINALIKI